VRLLRWVTVAVLAVEVALLSTGRLGLGQAAIVLLGVEIAFAALIVTVAVWRFTGSRRTGGSIPGALGDAITAAHFRLVVEGHCRRDSGQVPTHPPWTQTPLQMLQHRWARFSSDVPWGVAELRA